MSDYRAAYVIPGPSCCAAVSAVTDQAWLLREAPQLPLSFCTRSDQCACRYQKIPDRRQTPIDRRMVAAMAAASAQAGLWSTVERRRSPGRRATDLAAVV